MSSKRETEMQRAQKQELEGAAEQTRSGPVFTPRVDIFETENAITLLADLPGVESDQLNIDLRENLLTLTANVETPESENETTVLREFHYGGFYRQFTLSEGIDQSKIEANLRDGVLRLTLPKVEAAKPRRIAVKTG